MRTAGAAGWLLLAAATAAHAVVFYSTGDPLHNSTAPDGDLTGSGWQFQGRYRSFLGTPVGPHHFLTAAHFGGAVGEYFYFDGKGYRITAQHLDPDSDLALYAVDGTFPRFAPLYLKSDENGKALVVFGRGTDRGDPVSSTITNGFGRNRTVSTITNGWRWGAYNYTQRWGENTVSGLVTVNTNPCLQARFDQGGGTNECMLTDRDSGGGIFIKDGAVWKLAGINYAVNPWRFSQDSGGTDPFGGAMTNYHGLYVETPTGWTYQDNDAASVFYGTRLSARLGWITNNIPNFDTDADGLPDWWETAYGGDPLGMDPAGNPDADPVDNLGEWLADTDPTNGVSWLRIETVAGSPADTLTFTLSTARQFRVELNDALDGRGPWVPAFTNWLPGKGHPTIVTVTNAPAASGSRWYRVYVPWP